MRGGDPPSPYEGAPLPRLRQLRWLRAVCPFRGTPPTKGALASPRLSSPLPLLPLKGEERFEARRAEARHFRASPFRVPTEGRAKRSLAIPAKGRLLNSCGGHWLKPMFG